MTLKHNDEEIRLPASKRTRALLAYLAISNRPHRRENLCEVFWEIPDDPRGALRWSLSKIRPLVNTPDEERLQADRERVLLDIRNMTIDIHQITSELKNQDLPSARLTAIAEQLQYTFLEGLELPDQDRFQLWLNAERRDRERQLATTCGRLAGHRDIPVDDQLLWARRWCELAPLSPESATMLVTQLDRMALSIELSATRRELSERFQKASIPWNADARADLGGKDHCKNESTRANFLSDRELLAQQKIQFCTAKDGVRIAYAAVGPGSDTGTSEAPTIVKAANWLTHLEHDWDAPIWSPLFRDLASDHHFVRYDERGNGLSDWHVDDISFNAFVTDLESVVDVRGVEKFSLLGISQGAAVSIDYAVRYPERVKHLILFGGYAAGWRIGASATETREREAVMTLTASGWGQDNPAYRQIFSSTFMPTANSEEFAWFNEFQRLTTSPENAVKFLSVFSEIDVRDKLAQIQVPTLVIHSLDDQRIPVAVGRELAAAIPSAEFLGLESSGHLLLGREPASKAFVNAVREFIARN
nr:alpha/beta hydrolase [Microbulbifer celer]